MWKYSIKAGIITILFSILGMIIGSVLLIFLVESPEAAVGTIFETMTRPENLANFIRGALTMGIADVPVIVLILGAFFFIVGLFQAMAITPSASVAGMEFGGEVKEKKEKKAKKKEKKKKKKEKQKEEAVEKPQPEEQPVVDTGNYCQICGKPIPLGRAICKECEEALKRGEIPATFNVQQTQGTDQGA